MGYRSDITAISRDMGPLRPPPKENNLENFSGLKEKLSRPVEDARTPFFSAKKGSALEQGGLCFLFPSSGTLP